MALRAVCTSCQREFAVRFSYQSERSDDGALHHFCSIECRTAEVETCDACSVRFTIRYAYQVVTLGKNRKLACSERCRAHLLAVEAPAEAKRKTRVIAVLNQKGGTGKTTTSVSVAAGLAERGFRTLLIDLDAQGNVGISFGVSARRNVYHVLIDDVAPEDAIVGVRRDLDLLCCDQAMAAAELELVDLPDRARVLARRLRPVVAGGKYDFILLDCGPSLSLLNQNALTFAREVLIPVSCDYLALVGVKQILKTVRHVNDSLLHSVEVLGVVPTFFDVRNKISKQAVDALESYFKERVFPPVRINARLKEAPSHDKTIFEYAPDSRGAADYRAIVERIAPGAEAAPVKESAGAMVAVPEVATHG